MLLYLVHSKVVNIIKYYFRLLYNNKMLINFSQLFPSALATLTSSNRRQRFVLVLLVCGHAAAVDEKPPKITSIYTKWPKHNKMQ